DAAPEGCRVSGHPPRGRAALRRLHLAAPGRPRHRDEPHRAAGLPGRGGPVREDGPQADRVVRPRRAAPANRPDGPDGQRRAGSPHQAPPGRPARRGRGRAGGGAPPPLRGRRHPAAALAGGAEALGGVRL
ncbi:MAG: hypothetical protein AVDCRST_MAG68-4986, partial [uncultured Gemmatimonadetes bacterium]